MEHPRADPDAGGIGGVEVIVANTKMRKIPSTCKVCKLSKHSFGGDRVCAVVGKDCPMDFCNGNWKYGKPAWCPLVEIKRESDHEE